jgi:hypothetical protein
VDRHSQGLVTDACLEAIEHSQGLVTDDCLEAIEILGVEIIAFQCGVEWVVNWTFTTHEHFGGKNIFQGSSSSAFYWHSKQISGPPLCPIS